MAGQLMFVKLYLNEQKASWNDDFWTAETIVQDKANVSAQPFILETIRKMKMNISEHPSKY